MRPSATSTARLVLLIAATSVAGEFVNRTIDDQFGDEVTALQVIYTPVDLWNQGNNCTGCAFRPDNQSAHDGTWHDGTLTPSHGDSPLSFSFSFNGSAIYVYNILTRLTLTDVNITLDGNQVGTFTRFQNVSVFEQYVYNVPIFSMESIPYGEHTLTVTADGQNTTLVLFDYAVYTTNTTSSDIPSGTIPSGASSGVTQTKHKTNVGAIVGGVVGGVALIAVCLIAFLLYRRRHRLETPVHGKLSETFIPDPFPTSGRRSPPTTSQSSETTTPSTIATDRPASSHSDKVSPRSDSSPSVADDARSLHQQIQFFRAQFEALRLRTSVQQTSSHTGSLSEKGSNIGSQTDASLHAPSPMASEMALLRAEVAQLRVQQENNSPTSLGAASSPDTADLLRELAVLRGEVEEMRMQQDLSHLDPLPEYSPPPSTTQMDGRPLPSTPGVERAGHW